MRLGQGGSEQSEDVECCHLYSCGMCASDGGGQCCERLILVSYWRALGEADSIGGGRSDSFEMRLRDCFWWQFCISPHS